jgi:hypothetical protein
MGEGVEGGFAAVGALARGADAAEGQGGDRGVVEAVIEGGAS